MRWHEVSDVDGDIKEMLREKAEEMRLEPATMDRVVHRGQRRRVRNAVVIGTVAAGVIVGAVFGIQAGVDAFWDTKAVPATQQTPSRNEPTPAGEPEDHEVWFTNSGHLFLVHKSGTRVGGDVQAMEALLKGPTDEEAAAEVSSALPPGTRLETMSTKDGLARVQLSTDVQSDPLADAQVVYTLTQFSYVQMVLINDQEGGPLTRADLADQLPAILVEEPAIGGQVASPVTVSGTADVFEATVSIRILDANGGVLTDAHTSASCGTGCRGDYSKQVPYHVDTTQRGTVVVFEASAENGQPVNVVRIPVTLEANPAQPPASGTTVWRPIDDPSKGGAVDTSALLFAHEIMGWNSSKVHLETSGGGSDGVQVQLWNKDITTQFTPELATTLTMQQVAGMWSVIHASSGLFDVTCPSIRQDVIVTTNPDGSPASVPICGTFGRPTAGWVVTATLEYADSDLHASEAQAQADLPVNGQDFRGSIPLTATYVGQDVAVRIEVRSGSGTMLGIYARRFITETTGASG